MPKNQTKELLEEMLHPVRMRIMMALAGTQGLTPLQVAELLTDVPQATLYRQINRLAKSGILQVVDERPVRGTLEKVYALEQSGLPRLGNEAMSALSKEDHLRYFTSFTFTLIDEFSRYLNHTGTVDMAADGVGYQQIPLFLSDEELADFARAFNQALMPYIKHEDAPGRKKRLFSTTLMPEVTGEK